MAIEDHPKFPEWSQALEQLQNAWDAYTTAKAFAPKIDHSDKEATVREAMRRFNKISDEIDA
jgi:hypothetical protein